jgi:hypothetical protein
MSEQRAVSEPATTPDGGTGLPFGLRTRHTPMLELGSRADFDDRGRNGAAFFGAVRDLPGGAGGGALSSGCPEVPVTRSEEER